jgi:glutamate dehydrogenase
VPVATLAEWQSQLAEQLGTGGELAAERFAAGVPAAYRDRVPPEQAALDLAQLEQLVASAPPDRGAADATGRFGGAHRFTIGAAPDGAPGSFRLRRYGLGAVELSSLLPVLESFGLAVVEAVPTFIPGGPDGQPSVHIDDVGVRLDGVADDLDVARDGDRLVEALEAIARGAVEIDSLNRLVVAAGLTWVQVRVLRAYRRYRHQAGSTMRDGQLDDPLVAFPSVAAGLVQYFEARFDPAPRAAAPRAAAPRAAAPASGDTASGDTASGDTASGDTASGDTASGDTASGVPAASPGALERRQVVERVEGVVHREQDLVLRDYLALIDATVRTSYFLRTASGQPLSTLTVKLRSHDVPDLPAPRPEVEAFVHGVGVEGIHLRFGRIARGGIRWSDRPDDLRTEILGLAEAQVKKNAIIVPTGAKGGFVCRRPAVPSPPDVRSAYEIFIGALLDITDNLVDGRVVTPAGVVALDGEDTYLVVAADRGTASFSDAANDLAAAHGYWLGDAFASGGSHGYDHKAMGITARGAWVAVRRHFHQLGIDVQTEAVRVAGIGDMSGDVFGNGMLQSRTIELVAAFDHRHIFIDPKPDAARSFEERRRLAALGPSSWDDYDRRAISEGGGVWSRDDRSVPLAPEARAALGLTADHLSPPALISAILSAPVDLLWFGGIGTYVKAPDEADAEVGDHANDEVRVVADQVRARVIAEGGNLGVTNRARIRYSRRGGRINADFIDNAAGVATSDREVNLKILLTLAIERHRLAPDERDTLLRAVEDHVATEVLRQVDHSVGALNRAVPDSALELDAYESLLDGLEAAGKIHREVEALPSPEEWQRRRAAGAGLIRPELAVLLASAKSDLLDAIGASDLPSDLSLREAVNPYFAPLIRERFADLIGDHPLYPQLVATDLAGEIVDQMGIVWAHETAAELDVTLSDVAGAFWTARQLLDAEALWRAGEDDDDLSADADAALHRAVAEAVGRLARRYILDGQARPAARIEADRDFRQEMASPGPSVIATPTADLEALGVPATLAARVAAGRAMASLADVAAVARRSGRSAGEVRRAWDLVSEAAGIASLTGAVAAAPVTDRWSIWQARGILDDATTWCATASDAALTDAGGDVEVWLSARAPALRRVRRLIGALASGRGAALAIASLAVRALPRDG